MAGYVHNAWLTEGGNYLMSTEETQNKTVKLWDIRDLSNISISDEYLGPNNFAHKDAWGVFPFFPSGKILISDIDDGLYVVKFDDPDKMSELSTK